MPKPKQTKKTEAKHQASDPKIAPESLGKPPEEPKHRQTGKSSSEYSQTPLGRAGMVKSAGRPEIPSRLDRRLQRLSRLSEDAAPLGLCARAGWKWQGNLPGARQRVREEPPASQKEGIPRAFGSLAGSAAKSTVKLPFKLAWTGAKTSTTGLLTVANVGSAWFWAPFVLVGLAMLALVLFVSWPA